MLQFDLLICQHYVKSNVQMYREASKIELKNSEHYSNLIQINLIILEII